MPEWSRTLYIGAFVWWAIALSRWDFRDHRLPDVLTLPAYPVAGVAVAAMAPQNLGESATLAVSTLAVAWIAHVALDLGFGDVKLLGVCALTLGITANPTGSATVALVATTAVAGIHAVIHLVVTRDRRSHIPLGPSILFGVLVGVASG
jgi:leader peptidase (prepilin peptidase)/N-methyltransferase